MYKTVLALVALSFIALPAWAHQPRLVEGSSNVVEIDEPEISKAYYAELQGEPDRYVIRSNEPFELYVGLTVPDIEGAETDFVVAVVGGEMFDVRLDGAEHEWTPFYEEFAGDDYLNGPEFRQEVGAGEYWVTVSSPDNEGKYVLATGDVEYFGTTEGLDALAVIPELKADYFGKSKGSFLFSVFGAVQMVVLVLGGFVIGLVWRKALKLFAGARKGVKIHVRNIGMKDRVVRLLLALFLLFIGVWLWIPAMMLIAGFVFYEAVSSWCVLYAAMGKNTCPIS
jgi:hypothetical protein